MSTSSTRPRDLQFPGSQENFPGIPGTLEFPGNWEFLEGALPGNFPGKFPGNKISRNYFPGIFPEKLN
jgi:hypothetical protein